MQRLRLKADGRIVELLDGREIPLVPEIPSHKPPKATVAPAGTVNDISCSAWFVRPG